MAKIGGDGGIPLYTVESVGYDGNPNLPAAPTILKDATKGSRYLEDTKEAEWYKATPGENTWVRGRSIGLQTEETFTITVSGSGEDPPPGYKVINQAEVNAWGDFATVSGAIAALYDLSLKHLVKIQPPAGVWTLAPGELDQMWRVNPTVDGWIRISGDAGWAQIAGTSQVLAVSSDGDGNVILTSDPAPAVDVKAYYLYVVSGTGAGQYKPIRTHSGNSIVVAGAFNPPLDDTSFVQISEPATTLNFNEAELKFKGKPEDTVVPLVEFWHLNITIPFALGRFASKNVNMAFGGGTRFDGAWIFCFFVGVQLGDVIFDVRNYGWIAIDVRSGHVICPSSSTTLYLLGNSAKPAIVLWGAGSTWSAFGTGTHLSLNGWVALDGWTGPYLHAASRNCFVSLYVQSAARYKTDQGGSFAAQIDNGSSLWIQDLSDLAASTFKGVTSDIELDGNGLLWSDVDADPDKSAMSRRGSVVVED